MPYIMANVSTLEFWRPQAFGAPPLRARCGAAQRHTDAAHYAWLTLIVALLDAQGDVWVEKSGAERGICWYGDQVVLLRSTDTAAALVPEDLQLVRGLAGQPRWTSYEYAVAHYKDLTRSLKPWWSAQSPTVTAKLPIRNHRKKGGTK